ncbi:MAG: monovalent cation/H+ antiporter complex subunit F [Verrucomicrobiales bacterium]|nr:monovalent cation/H+ antiporter complex subunit F [Verrucomicrobiales bacterium]
MNTFFVWSGMALLLMMVPIFYRMQIGPTAIDRIVAVNVIGTKTAVLLIFIGTIYPGGRVEMFVDFALAYGLLNFIGSLAAARYFHRSKVEGGGIDVEGEAEES